jgi:hypothetical protein
VLADLCQQRLTTPARLRETLASYPRLPGRALLAAVLDDVATGAYSVLERRYLPRVERPHGLPRAQRQGAFTQGSRSGFRDVQYVAQRVTVELDGRLGHEFAVDQWVDLERDLFAAVDEQLTIRLGWGLVAKPCRLAVLMGGVLRSRGWVGQASACPECRERGNSPAPGAGEFPRIG